jgi:hypothetical protein
MSNAAKDAFVIVERELLKFSSYENVRSILSKYSIGQYDKDLVEKLLVILSTEFRRKIENLNTNLPDDEVEAMAVIQRKAAAKRGRKPKEDGLDIEVVDDFDLLELDED